MVKQVVAALLSAAAIVPATAGAQDVGEQRRARLEAQADVAVDRPAPTAGGWAQRAPRSERAANPGGWQQRGGGADRPAPPAGGWAQNRRDDAGAFRRERRDDRQEFRQERRADFQGFRQERRDDRAALAAGQVTQDQFRRDRRDDRRDFRTDRRDDVRDFRQDRRGDRRDFARDGRRDYWRDADRLRQRNGADIDWRRDTWRGDRYAGNNWDGRSGWNRDWRSDRRYDWNGWRQQNRGYYRLPRYYAPSGWGYGYRRFGIGVTLFSSLWAQDYWIGDPWQYRLPPAYGPYRWVRYYDDALLVDLRTGIVVDTVYDIFW